MKKRILVFNGDVELVDLLARGFDGLLTSGFLSLEDIDATPTKRLAREMFKEDSKQIEPGPDLQKIQDELIAKKQAEFQRDVEQRREDAIIERLSDYDESAINQDEAIRDYSPLSMSLIKAENEKLKQENAELKGTLAMNDRNHGLMISNLRSRIKALEAMLEMKPFYRPSFW